MPPITSISPECILRSDGLSTMLSFIARGLNNRIEKKVTKIDTKKINTNFWSIK